MSDNEGQQQGQQQGQQKIQQQNVQRQQARSKDDQVKQEISKRQQAFDRMQEEDSEIEHQPDGDIVQGRTKEYQQKLINKVAAHRREAGLETNRERSSSRRDRRKRLQKAMDDGKHMKTGSLTALEDADARGELMAQGPFERIGPDSTAMDGPVTHARVMRGEIPVRGSDPSAPYYMPQEKNKGSSLKDNDGLKLTISANLEVELDLRASIRGDITLSLFA